MKRILFLAAFATLATTAANAQSQGLSRTNKRVHTVNGDTTRKAGPTGNNKAGTRIQTDADRNNPANPNNPVKPTRPATPGNPPTPNGTTTPSGGTAPKGNVTNPAR